MPILAILFTNQEGRPTKHKGVISWEARGLVPKTQGDGFASELGEIMEVTMWLCVPLLRYTSRKHGKKEPHSFSHCGSFDHCFAVCCTNCQIRLHLKKSLTAN